MAIAYATPLKAQTDTVCIPKSDALRVLKEAKEGRAYKDLNELLKVDTATLGKRVRENQIAIGSLNKTIASYERDTLLYEQIIALQIKQTKVAEEEVADWKKEYKKEKRKRFITGVSGAVLTIAALLYKK